MIQSEAVSLTRELVRIESTNPGTGESKIGEFILNYLKNTGAETKTYEVREGRFNVYGRLPGRLSHPALVFICHMDTVIAGEGWNREPFSGELENECIWGRGSCDMKSGLACALAAFRETAEKMKKGSNDFWQLSNSLVFIGTVDEEGDMEGAEAVLSREWVSKEDWILDMEPTSGNIQMAHKGRTWFELEIKGLTAHASMPEKGADAIAGAAFMIAEIRKRIEACKSHPELGKSTVTFGQISGGYSPYVVSDKCKVTVDMRLVPPMNTKKAEELVCSAIETGEQMVPGVKGSYKITGDRPWVETHWESKLLEMLRKSVKEVTGAEAKVTAFPGYTDTAVIAGKLGNFNCMSYGPGNLEQAHKPNEYVNTTDIERCQEVFMKLVENMLTEKRVV